MPDRSLAALESLRLDSLGRLLFRAFRRYDDAALEAVRRRGHPELTVAHALVLPHIEVGGSRLTDIAARARMTKQSASELVAALERLGYLTRAKDSEDRRAQRVLFTKKGKSFLLAAFDAKTALERDAQKRLGKPGEKQLMQLLRNYVGDAE